MTETSPHDVDLEQKTQPRQKRAIATYERLLDVAARLLEEEGVERISTNLIAEKAGITPPALYRYFPNKYAILRALGDRLMQRQNALFNAFLARRYTDKSRRVPATEAFLKETLKVTREQPGALAIMRAMRAVPSVQHVRTNSHREVTDIWTDDLVTRFPHVPRETLWAKARLTVEFGYAAIEMAMEETTRPGPDTVLREAALNLTAYWSDYVAAEEE